MEAKIHLLCQLVVMFIYNGTPKNYALKMQEVKIAINEYVKAKESYRQFDEESILNALASDLGLLMHGWRGAEISDIGCVTLMKLFDN